MNITTKLLCLSVSRRSTSIGGDGVKRYNEVLKFTAIDFEDSDAVGPAGNAKATVDIDIIDQMVPGVFEPGTAYDVTIMPST